MGSTSLGRLEEAWHHGSISFGIRKLWTSFGSQPRVCLAKRLRRVPANSRRLVTGFISRRIRRAQPFGRLPSSGGSPSRPLFGPALPFGSAGPRVAVTWETPPSPHGLYQASCDGPPMTLCSLWLPGIDTHAGGCRIRSAFRSTNPRSSSPRLKAVALPSSASCGDTPALSIRLLKSVFVTRLFGFHGFCSRTDLMRTAPRTLRSLFYSTHSLNGPCPSSASSPWRLTGCPVNRRKDPSGQSPQGLGALGRLAWSP
jgi:hypothetical protein